MNNRQSMVSADAIMTTSDVSRALDISVDRVRQLERVGVLTARRTESGVRIFSRTVIDEFRRRRGAKRTRIL
jgi:DNA-binding transcriptional MerR regulator